MQIFSYRSGGSWRAVEPTNKDENGKVVPDEAQLEITRSLSDCFRCNNLVVLTGLGTSLNVNVKQSPSDKPRLREPIEGKRLAPTMGDLWSAVKNKNDATFENVFSLSKCPENSRGNIETLLSYCKAASDFIDDPADKAIVEAFIESAEDTVRDSVRFLTPDDDLGVHSDFLRRLARRSSRKIRSKIFTTNYDLCFEYAARRGRYVVIDGFSHTTPQVFDSLFFSYDIVKRDSNPDSHDFIPNVFHLYKLHGSVDWTKNQKTGEIEKDDSTETPILVYPRNTKYELAFEQPYLEMMSAFQSAIRQPDTGLLILGFGFNDNHIAEPILSAINSNLHLKVVVCDPALGPWMQDGTCMGGADTKNPHLAKIRYLIEHGDARLSLISATFKEIVPHLPDIAAETDLEQHVERVRLLRGAA
ncbi:SIR2 family protein [Cupriavidus pinatubonensis]|uniref:SIR2 family protein n=1 Tax=Cupriavidus pinatubonensis TaxID=248026 RepID=UPI001C73D0D6|nr:SIR2 family protein [Cupriavidus pinatubonensis]QYY30859.1 SIR2 family protein [Cupriavidus pinatubonensis]